MIKQIVMVPIDYFHLSLSISISINMGIILKPSHSNLVCKIVRILGELKTCIAQVSCKAGPRFCTREIVVIIGVSLMLFL
jgi:hypothetical protein